MFVDSADLKRKVLARVHATFGKTAVSFLVLSVFGMIVFFGLLTPFFAFGMAALPFFLPLGLVCSVLLFIPQFGFFVIVFRLYRGERTVLGHLLCGFRDWKRLACLGAGLCGIYVALSVVASVVIAFARVSGTVETAGTDTAASLASMLSVFAVFAAVMLSGGFLLFRFVFVFPLLAEDVSEPKQKVRTLLRKSAGLLNGQKIRLFLFCLNCGGVPLVAAVAAFFVIIAGMCLPLPAALTQVCSFIYTVSYVMSVVRILMAVSAWYDALCPSATGSPVLENPEVYSIPEQTAGKDGTDDEHSDGPHLG